MAEPRDEEVRARYRALATEEPSAAIDDAIRAAARRAVASAPGRPPRSTATRWAVPVSLAAVLFLSFGVVMHMEKEVAPISADLLRAGPPVYSAPPSSMAPPLEEEAKPEAQAPRPPPATQPAPKQRQALEAERARAPAKRALPEDKLLARPEPLPLAKEALSTVPGPAPAPAAPPPASIAAAPAPMAVPAAPPAEARPAPQPKAFADAPAAAARESAATDPRNVAPGRRDEAVGAAGLATPRAKTESFGMQRAAPAAAATATAKATDSAEPWPDTPEKKLERIETLRKAGRDREADEAIARFRREHPDHRIPEALWERIRPR